MDRIKKYRSVAYRKIEFISMNRRKMIFKLYNKNFFSQKYDMVV